MDDAGLPLANAAPHDKAPVQLERNKLVDVFYPAFTRLLGGAPSDSDLEVEILPPTNALGKRPFASTSNGTTAKQPRLSPSDSQGLEVLHLHFALDPSELEVDNRAEKRSFINTLLQHPSSHHPAPLTPVEFIHTRGNPGKAPPSIFVTLPESRDVTSRTKILALDPRNHEHPLVNRWAAGRAAASFGETSVLEACLLLQGQGHLVVKGELFVHCPANAKQLDDLIFHLTIAISMLPSFYTLRYPTNTKRLFIDRLFPPASSSSTDNPREASVNLFYSSLKRAPRTTSGIPVVSSLVKSRTRTPVVQVEETAEERETRLRREAKGKGRAIEPEEEEMDVDEEGGDGEGFQTPKKVDLGPEDELLYPPGLKPTLMPFQSRTVRWLLSREGKRVRPTVKDEGEDVAMGEAGPSTNGGVVHLNDHDEEELEDAAEGHDKKDDDNHPLAVLEDLPEVELITQRRGPLWESVTIPLPSSSSSPSTSTPRQQFWINRVTSSLSIEDPGVKAVASADHAGKEEDEDEEEEEEEEGVELHWGSGNNGLLAEEVGLGKTVEVLSLILLNPDPDRLSLPSYFNPLTDSDVKPTPMTLIIAPAAIVGQWEAEIAKHAPGLRVLRYDSIKKIKETWTPEFIASKYDILLTTFDVLRREVVLARRPHERALRSGKEGRHRYRRSLFVQIDFLRIILDEAQMLGDQASATSETASLIPRKYSFCVTSTPLKSRIEDLQGLLAFLRVEPFGASRGALSRLIEEVPTFIRVCESLGARTLKAQVDHELVIPEQARFVVPVEFTAVEKYWYDSRYAEALEILGLDSDGTPKDEGVNPATGEPYPWAPDQGDLNRWLVTLRQVCCHPQIGKAAKEVLGNVLKTHDEVLASMLEKALSAVWGDQRQLLFTRVKRAQYLTYDKEDCERFETALEIYGSTLLDLDELITEVGDAVKAAWELRKARIQRAGSTTSSSIDGDKDSIAGLLSLGLADEEDVEDHKLTEKDRMLIKNLGALRNRLRELLFIQHKCHFFSGSAYYNMDKFPDEESEAYARAERLRVVILNPYERNVDRAIRLLDEQQEERDEEEELDITDLELSFSKVGRGIVAREAFDDATTTVDISNGYAELIWSWRESILGMMKTRVSIAGDDATGEEYEARAALQEKLNCYLEAYNVLLDDWRHALLGGHRSALATQLQQDIFGKDKKKEFTAANRLQRKKKNIYIPLKDRRVPRLEEGDTPEEILRFELLVERIEAKGEDEEETEPVPLRHIINTLKEALEKNTVPEEKKLLEVESRRLKKEVWAKEKVADRLRSELSDVTKAFNSRLRYFAQLQVLSDEVQDPTFMTDAKVSKKFKGFPTELATLAEEEEKLEASIEKKASARRYLEALNADSAKPAEETTCTICSDVYTKGVLTVCGHLVCEPCFTAWIARSRQCPLCRRPLGRGDWEVVKYRHHAHDGDPQDDEEDDGDVEMFGDGLVLNPPVKLSTVDRALLTAIESIDTVAPLSSKSDVIVKHISHIRRDDPTAKCLIFSCWQESLNILMTAMQRNDIGFVRLEAGGKKESIVARFHEDPDVAVFFLHTKSQSAGLNLTCAQYVFLVEPLLHPSLEVQAIARVHRIGQTQQTTVFQYYVADTVDQRVAELRGRQGTSLFLPKRNSAQEARVNQQDMATKSKHGAGDESIDDEDDISRCLFHPEHYLALQRSLLPSRLRAAKKEKGKANGDDGAGAAGRAGQAAIARAAAASFELA